ncbi:MAG: hypothetical protein PWR10_1279 [Halanaerobiales bacterium]|nr:hypothetical protein [Halanaerobiales bacterium]
MQRELMVFLVLSIIVLCTSTVYGIETFFTEIDQYNNLRLGNDYIVVVMNMDENGQGRFAIETTGGAPLRSNDENKPLIYGRPKPWTSYTTIWINGDYYVFGGSTGRRAGKAGKYGEVIQPPHIKDGSIHTTTKFADKLKVEQILTIVKSSTTGLYDTVQIKYRVENISQEVQKVGMRIMLDTMLGQNDGAPFRIGNDAVTTDKVYYKKQLPAFWQAFDSISHPNVTSQGSFTGSGVTAPDKVCLADWGSLADGVWDFDFNPGEDFLRKGEYEIDSAIAMYWVPELLEPGASRSYITNYGLGGITIVPGLLSLGVTSPAEVTFDTPDKTFPIIAYVENTSEIKAKKVKIRLSLPDSLKAEGKEKSLGDLEPGEITQVAWYVKTAGNELPPKVSYLVKVEAENTDSNQVKREIKFVGPPNLETTLKMVDELRVNRGRLEPNPFKLEASISNSGGSTLYDVSTELILPPGLLLATKEKARKYPGNIQAGETVKVRWQVKALQVEGQLPFAVDVRGLHGYKEIARFDNLNLPELGPLMYLSLKEEDKVEAGDYITVDIIGVNIRNDYGDKIDRLKFNLKYNPEYLKPVSVSPGDFFIKGSNLLPWSKPDLSESGLIKFAENIPTEKSQGILASIHFKVLKVGEHQIEWEETKFISEDNDDVEVSLKGLKFIP